MAYQFKSKTLQALQAKREQQAKDLVARIGREFTRVKQSTEELTGERGENRAIRQKDFDGLTRVKMNTGGLLSVATTEDKVAALQADVENLYRLLAKIAGE